MKTLKVMSIIGLVYFSLSFFFIIVGLVINVRGAIGWGIIGLFYAIPFSIVGLIISIKAKKKENMNLEVDFTPQLLELKNLREKEIITEQEFSRIKAEYLNTMH